jgi:hypothetical protein
MKLNPNGVVPTFVHDGNVVTESSLISIILTRRSQIRRSCRGRQRACATGYRSKRESSTACGMLIGHRSGTLRRIRGRMQALLEAL